MRRREFIALLGGAAAIWPLAASAQQADQVRRIGVLSNIGERSRSTIDGDRVTRTPQTWLDRWRNLRVDHRWAAGNPSVLPPSPKNLLHLSLK